MAVATCTESERRRRRLLGTPELHSRTTVWLSPWGKYFLLHCFKPVFDRTITQTPYFTMVYLYDLQVHRDEDGLTDFIAWSTRRRKHAHRSYHRLSLLHHLDTGHGMPASQCSIAAVEHF